MIQATLTSGGLIENYIYLQLGDVSTVAVDADLRPLISIKSQQTQKVLNFMPTSVTSSTAERYNKLTYKIGADYPLGGLIVLGTTDYPLGFYDVTIYQNNLNSNLDPANTIKTLYTGLMNLISSTATAQYTEYTTNDSDTESVYITF
tara:strand:- start:1093 stop:1533 length:441 start_codon:yes stop_codon:yes gene_type:complete